MTININTINLNYSTNQERQSSNTIISNKQAFLLFCHSPNETMDDVLIVHYSLHKAAKANNISVSGSFHYTIDRPNILHNIIEILRNLKKAQKENILIITNNFKLAEESTSDNNLKVSTLIIRHSIIDLYQADLDIELYRIEVDHV